MKNQMLSDDNLEKLSLIKEIDTISIINKADEIMKKSEMKKINAIGIAICLLLLIFNAVTVFICGIKTFIIFQIFIVWVSPLLIFFRCI